MAHIYTLVLKQCFLPGKRSRQFACLSIALVCHGQSAAWIWTHCLIAHMESGTVLYGILKDADQTSCCLGELCELSLQREMENMGMSVSWPPLSLSA